MVQYSNLENNPLYHEPSTSLGPDALEPKFVERAKERLKERGNMKLADVLLDQTFVAGIGNKYCSYKKFGRSSLSLVSPCIINRGY
jgi:formamidopyrimidine-DNA glycosylase